MRDRFIELAGASGDGARPPASRLADVAFEATMGAHLVVGGDGVVTLANAQARKLLGVSSADLGRPLKDLRVSHMPIELRSQIDRARSTHRAAVLRRVLMTTPDGEQRTVEVVITPLLEGDDYAGTSIVYEDVTSHTVVLDELARSRRELETSYGELQSAVEELETTNEELETMNEELHSTNEELETTNDEVRRRSSDIDDVNDVLEAILTGLGVAVVVLDESMLVQVWNQHAGDQWGVRADEAEGRHLLDLDIGLSVDDLRAPIRGVLDGTADRESVTLRAINRRGRAISCLATAIPLRRDGRASGAILLMEQSD